MYKTEGKRTVILIRHGRTKQNIDGVYMGRGIDAPLSLEGIEEIKAKRDRIREAAGDTMIFAGGMKRARQTAELIFYDRTVNVIPELTEIDFGDLEGKPASLINSDPIYGDWRSSEGNITFPHGENVSEFTARTVNGLHNILNMSADSPRISIVCHGGNIMAMMSSLTGGNYFDYMVPNLEGYVIDMTYDKKKISDVTYERFS